jgi:hypothetical protein
MNYLFDCNHIRLHDIFSQNKPPPIFSEGVILNIIGYCEVFLARGFAGFFSAGAGITAGFFTKVRFFFSTAAFGAGAVSTANGGVVNGTYGSGVVAAGGSNLYGADTAGVVTASRGWAKLLSGFFPVKNSTIFLNMGVSYALFITGHI